MSRNKFIKVIMLINVAVCVAIAGMYFSGQKDDSKADHSKVESLDVAQSELDKQETTSDDTNYDPQINFVDNTDSKEPVSDTETVTNQTAQPDAGTTAPTTNQAGAGTTAPTTNKADAGTTAPTTNQADEGTTDETTVPGEIPTEAPKIPAYAQGKTSAVVNKACNVRERADMSANVIGQTVRGTSYTIDPEKCRDNWVAIVYNGGIGYVGTSFCSFE